MVKLVPTTSTGASRRAYQHGYSKSATNKVSDLLGKRKLTTPAFKPAKQPAAAQGRDYGKDAPPEGRVVADFGGTGFLDPRPKPTRY